MKRAISNIAWKPDEDAAAHALMRELGIQHLEMAPTRHWPDLSRVTEPEATAVADSLKQQGLSVCAFQAILFGQPQLQLFGEDAGRACREYLKAVCRLAGWMGAGAVVFGAPKNRLRGNLSDAEAQDLAVAFFQDVGSAAAEAGTKLCVEPNPAAYGGDFLFTAAEVGNLVRRVDSPGIAVNFDMGEQAMHQADPAENLRKLAGQVGHFHASEPMLEPFSLANERHTKAAAALATSNFSHFVSLEMKTPTGGLASVRTALAAMKQIYFTLHEPTSC